jgi:hypothetical protein
VINTDSRYQFYGITEPTESSSDSTDSTESSYGIKLQIPRNRYLRNGLVLFKATSRASSGRYLLNTSTGMFSKIEAADGAAHAHHNAIKKCSVEGCTQNKKVRTGLIVLGTGLAFI